jgi:type IV pilus assembly protein PilC
LLKNKAVKERIDNLTLSLPLLGELILMLTLERFCSTMYILLESGVPMVYSLDVINRSVNNSTVARSLSFLKDNVKKGHSLSSELAKIEQFPPLISEITRIGEEAGNMPQMFQKISIHYQHELTAKMDQIIALFEPIMIFTLGIIIGTIVIALFLPIFRLTSLGGK